jgi:hypothetical protein
MDNIILIHICFSFSVSFSVLVFKTHFAFADINNDIDNATGSSISGSYYPKSSPSFRMPEIENIHHHWIDVYRGIPSN